MEAASDAVSSEISPADQDIPLPAENAPAEPSSSETLAGEVENAPVGGDAPAAEDEPAPPPAPETVHAWLAQIKAGAILALLRKPDFAYVGMNAFVGHRVNPTNYALPLVRGRLVQAAIKNEEFAEKLLALAEAAAAQPPPSPEVSTPSPSAALDVPLPPPPPTDREMLRAERERGKTVRVQLDGARLALIDAQAAREQAAESQHQAEAARADAERHAGELEKEAARWKRRVERLRDEVLQISAERDTLRKALKQAHTEPRPNAGGHHPERRASQTAPASALWQDAAMHLLHRRRYDLALLLAEEVLRLDARNVPALDMAAQAHEARSQGALAAPFVRALLEQAIAEGRLADAADAWLRGLRLPAPADAEKSLRALLRALRPDDTAGVRQMRVVLSRLQGMAPQTHAVVAEQITRHASPALAESLMPPPGMLTSDDPLPLGLPLGLTARAILEAIDMGDDLLVAEAREAWARLVPGSDDAERVRAALERAAGDDQSVLQPLLRAPRGPVLVDASNVALHGQEMLARPRPRLRALQSMRSALLKRGWFPVFTIADANLPHHIDEPDALADLRARRIVRLVDSGTQADESLLREAKRLSAPLVTNDYMTDWDPQGAVTKIRYTFSHTGEVWLDQ